MCNYLNLCTFLKRGILVTVMLLFQCICNGAAIKCFVCDSSDNPSCTDLKSNSSIVAEECTLDKMKSLDTWLFDLNKFSYFDTGANKSPLMNCQKVVARDPRTSKMVTARFCQLDTGDSDACAILRSKLKRSEESYGSGNNYYNSNNNNNNNRRGSGKNGNGQNPDGEDEEQFHCSICTTDRCNGSADLRGLKPLTGGAFSVLALMTLLIMQGHSVW